MTSTKGQLQSIRPATTDGMKTGNCAGLSTHRKQRRQRDDSDSETTVAANITQSMSRKGNCLDNSVMENFFGRLKVEMFYGETFRTTDEFIRCLEEYITYYNNERISLKLKMSPAQYRTQSQII